MTATEKLAICAASAFALVVALTPAAKALALRFNLIASPCEESGQPEPTPVLGGVAIVLAVIAALGLVGELPYWLTAGMVALLTVGVLDRCGRAHTLAQTARAADGGRVFPLGRAGCARGHAMAVG